MAPRKKKHQGVKVHNDESSAGRRSSLQVNLSYVSSLSDSGNGSLRIVQHENEIPLVGIKQPSSHVKLLPNITENVDFTVGPENPGMSAISDKEQALNESCQLLKDAIMNKTREIFDGRAELAVKTATILKGKRQALKEINEDSKKLGKHGKVMSKNVIIHSQSSKDRSFPKSSDCGLRTIEKPLGKISGDMSLILSGSEKSHRNSLLKAKPKVLRVELTRITDPRLETSIESSQSSISDFGAPITCSSFMSGYGNRPVVPQQAESDCRVSSENSDVEEPGKNIGVSNASLTPMEITAVQGPLPSTSKKSFKDLPTSSRILRLQGELSENRSSVEPMPMELTTVQSHIPFHDSSNSDKTSRTSLNVNTSTSVLSHQSETRKIARLSMNSKNNNSQEDFAISLRVNTSLETEENSPTQESIDKDDKESDNVEKSVMKDLEKTEDSDSDEDSVENMSLIARLRNISAKKLKGGDRSSIGEGPSFVEGTPFPPSRSILWKTQIRSETIRNKTAGKLIFPTNQAKNLSSLSDSDSSMSIEYMTPPNKTIVMDDSPCRVTCNILNPQIIKDSSEEEEEPSEGASRSGITNENETSNVHERLEMASTNESSKENETSNVHERLEMASTSGNSKENEISNVHERLEMASTSATCKENETSNVHEPLEEASGIQKKNTTPIVQKPGKKKLLPLRDNHEIVSFSPVSQIDSSPRKQKTWKPRKQFRKRKSTRAFAEKRIESSRREDEDDDDLPGSLIVGTKSQKGKVRKPRKVISKKIVVTRIAGNDLIDQIEGIGRRSLERSNPGQRSSIHEFSTKKRLSITERFCEPKKLVIVATGFSKGDVDLVKSIVKELGNAEISSTVSRRTSHVVSTGVRTINLLRGIIRGCWLVSLDWVLKSLEKRKWLNAEHYEMIHFSKAVQENRRDRQIFGKSYVPELFTTCGPIHIERGTSPPPEILKELIKTAGGRIAENLRDARLNIGSDGLREIWILDSITTGELQPIAEYQRK